MRYQKATFYFLSGTGNSYRVVAWMAEAATVTGLPVTLRPIESARPAEEIGPGEAAPTPILIGLTMPTHGFTAPWAMLRFALRLPRGAGESLEHYARRVEAGNAEEPAIRRLSLAARLLRGYAALRYGEIGTAATLQAQVRGWLEQRTP